MSTAAHALRTVSQCAYGLRAADGVHLVEAEQAGDGKDVAVGQPVGARRGTDPYLPHPGHPGGDGGHHERARVGGVPPGNVEAGAPDRAHPLARGGPAAAPLPGAVHLALVEGAYVLDGHEETLSEVGRQGFRGTVYLFLWNPDLARPHAVEALGVLEEGGVSPVAHVLHDPARCGPDAL